MDYRLEKFLVINDKDFLSIGKLALITLLACMLTANGLKAQMRETITSRWESYIKLDIYSRPFWKVDTIYDETVQPINDNGNVSCRLLYKASTTLT